MTPTADQPAAKPRDRPQYDDREKDRAARFLCSEMALAPHVRGMDDAERIRTWLAVAADLGDEDAAAVLNQRLLEVRHS